MNGNVFVDLKEEVECDAVIVQCKGKEKCYWQETRHRWALLFGERERDKLPGGRGTNCQAGEGHAARRERDMLPGGRGKCSRAGEGHAARRERDMLPAQAIYIHIHTLSV